MQSLRLILFPFLLLAFFSAKAQYTYVIKADSVKLTNSCDSTELILLNHTQGVHGFLYNPGTGRTYFQRGAIQLSAGVFVIGGDTIKTNSGFNMVPDIPTLEQDTASAANMVYVTDTLRGGLFVYQSTPAWPDSGKVFPATGRGSGYWIRAGARNIAANIEWYGAIPNVYADADMNYHAIQACINTNQQVFLPSGTWYCDSTLVITNGVNMFGAKANQEWNNNGALISMIDTISAINLNVNSGASNFSQIHDISLTNGASGGTLNHGFIINGGAFDIERMNISNFGGDGVHINLSGSNAQGQAQMILSLVTAQNNGNNGFTTTESGSWNIPIAYNSCTALNNGQDGFYCNTMEEIYTNCFAQSNGTNDIDDENSFNQFYSITANNVVLNGWGGTYQGVPGQPWPKQVNASYSVKIGSVTSMNQTLVSSVVPNNSDSITTGIMGGLGHFTIEAILKGAPNDGTIDFNGINGNIQTNGNFYFWQAWLPELQRFYLHNPGSSALNFTGDLHNFLITDSWSGLDEGSITSISPGGPNFFGGAMVAIGGQRAADSSDQSTDLAIFPRGSTRNKAQNAGVVRFTSMDSVNYTIRKNTFGARDYVDANTGQWNFYTFGPFGNDSTGYWFGQNYGSNINFENQDGSSNLYLNTFNKSAFVNLLKLGASPTPSTGDSILVWEAADSSVRKMAPSSVTGGSGGSYNGVGSGTPTVTTGTGAGTGASVSITGTNQGGMITLTTGTSLVASATMVSVTYSTPYPNNSFPITRAANQPTANAETTDQATFLSGNKNGFAIIANTTVLSANTTYVWYYNVSGQ
jgi:hypothetical protein